MGEVVDFPKAEPEQLVLDLDDMPVIGDDPWFARLWFLAEIIGWCLILLMLAGGIGGMFFWGAVAAARAYFE